MSIDVRVPPTDNAGEDVIITGSNAVVDALLSAGDVPVTLDTATAGADGSHDESTIGI